MPLDQIGQLEQDQLALVGLDLAPWAFKSSAGGGNRAVDIFRVALRHPRQDLAGGRIDAVERLARNRLDPLAVDQQPLHCTIEKRVAGLLNRLNHIHDHFLRRSYEPPIGMPSDRGGRRGSAIQLPYPAA